MKQNGIFIYMENILLKVKFEYQIITSSKTAKFYNSS